MKNRLISAAALVFFMAAIVICNNSFRLMLNISISLVCVLGVHEIISALGLSKHYVLLVPSLLFAAVFPFLEDMIYREICYFIYTVVIFGALIFYHSFITFREVGVIYSMSLLIPSALQMVVGLRALGGEHGMFYVIIAILSAWVSDVGGFLTGRVFGRHKLCPNISPKKTVEGAVGSLCFNIIAMLLLGYLLQLYYIPQKIYISYLALFLIGFFGTGISILGDLSFSLIKRSCKIKDFSELIPGHGGILDRFDSVIFEAPFVFFIAQFLPLVK